MSMHQPRPRLLLVLVLLAYVPAFALAAQCNERLDHDSNPLLANRLDEPLLLLSKQRVKELQEWECQSSPCSNERQITRFDKQGRVTEAESNGTLVQYSYEGDSPYPSRSVWTLMRDSFRPKGFLRESSEKYSDEGLRVNETRWISNGEVATFRDATSGYTATYLRGRLISSVQISMGWDGFPSNTLVEQDCKVREEAIDVTYVASHMKSKGSPQRITREVRFSSSGDLIWSNTHLPDGGVFEQVYENTKFDRKGNWIVRRYGNSNGETSTQYREISYWD